jgi:hypothetical protein
MAVILLHDSEEGTIRQGDVVFCRSNHAEYPLHIGIYVGDSGPVKGKKPQIAVLGLPERHGEDSEALGAAVWSSSRDNWRADIVGLMLEVDAARIKEVVLVAEAHEKRLSALGEECKWDEPDKCYIDMTRKILDGVGLFKRGTCAQYVEYLYEAAGLDILSQELVFDPANPKRIYPMTQLHAFWVGQYPLSKPWEDNFAKYPQCCDCAVRSQSR